MTRKVRKAKEKEGREEGTKNKGMKKGKKEDLCTVK